MVTIAGKFPVVAAICCRLNFLNIQQSEPVKQLAWWLMYCLEGLPFFVWTSGFAGGQRLATPAGEEGPRSRYQGMSVQSVNSALTGYVSGGGSDQSGLYPAPSAGADLAAHSVSDVGSLSTDCGVTAERHGNFRGSEQAKGAPLAAGVPTSLAQLLAGSAATGSTCKGTSERVDSQHRYSRTVGFRVIRAGYEQPPKDVQTRRNYRGTPRRRELHRAAQARYANSPKGREVRRVASAIRWARTQAYNEALAITHNEALARQKGEEAAARRKMKLEQTLEFDRISGQESRGSE